MVLHVFINGAAAHTSSTQPKIAGSSACIGVHKMFNPTVYVFIFLLQTLDGLTPLHFAVQRHWVAVAQQLIQAGVDMLVVNHQGFNVFMNAVTAEFDW